METRTTTQDSFYPVPTTIEAVRPVVDRCPISEQTIAEEWVNVLTHGLGLILGGIGAALLMIKALQSGSLNHIVACGIYGFSMIFLFGASTLYHAASVPEQKDWFRTSDHICIYFLIAGTYTPFGVLALKQGTGYMLVWTLWGMALIGTVCKIAAKFGGWKKRTLISTGFYLLMGWTGMFVMGTLKQTLPPIGYDLLIWGGLFYSVGTIFYMWKGLPHGHGIWHLFVLAGAGCHFFSVYFSVF